MNIKKILLIPNIQLFIELAHTYYYECCNNKSGPGRTWKSKGGKHHMERCFTFFLNKNPAYLDASLDSPFQTFECKGSKINKNKQISKNK